MSRDNGERQTTNSKSPGRELLKTRTQGTASLPGAYEVSRYNFEEEVVSGYNFPDKFFIVDSTLRKIQETPGLRRISQSRYITTKDDQRRLGAGPPNPSGRKKRWR